MKTQRYAQTHSVIAGLYKLGELFNNHAATQLAGELSNCRCWIRSGEFCNHDRLCEACNARMLRKRWADRAEAEATAFAQAGGRPVTVSLWLIRCPAPVLLDKLERIFAPFHSGFTTRRTSALSQGVAAGSYEIQFDPKHKVWVVHALLWLRPASREHIDLLLGDLRTHIIDNGVNETDVEIKPIAGTSTNLVSKVQKLENKMKGPWTAGSPATLLRLHQMFDGRRRGGRFGMSRTLVLMHGLDRLGAGVNNGQAPSSPTAPPKPPRAPKPPVSGKITPRHQP